MFNDDDLLLGMIDDPIEDQAIEPAEVEEVKPEENDGPTPEFDISNIILSVISKLTEDIQFYSGIEDSINAIADHAKDEIEIEDLLELVDEIKVDCNTNLGKFASLLRIYSDDANSIFDGAAAEDPAVANANFEKKEEIEKELNEDHGFNYHVSCNECCENGNVERKFDFKSTKSKSEIANYFNRVHPEYEVKSIKVDAKMMPKSFIANHK